METTLGTKFKSAFRHSKKSIFVSYALLAQLRQKMIAEVVYRLAKKRRFVLGYEQQDWFQAELVMRTQFPPKIEGNHEM